MNSECIHAKTSEVPAGPLSRASRHQLAKTIDGSKHGSDCGDDVHLSIIIPAFNEFDRIGPTLDTIGNYLKALPFRVEVIVVDDGSTDETASRVASKMSGFDRLSLITMLENTGKGAAVCTGMLRANGKYRLYLDADNSTRIEQLEKLLQFLEAGVPVVIGSRSAYGSLISTPQSNLRRLLGWMFRTIIRLSFSLPVTDTQNGFKAFSAAAAMRIFPEVTTSKWAFDVEALLIASKMGFVILEVPVKWINDPRSRMTPLQAITMGMDLIKIACRMASTDRSRDRSLHDKDCMGGS